MAGSILMPWLSLRKLTVNRILQRQSLKVAETIRVNLRFQSRLILPFVWIAVREELVNRTRSRMQPIVYQRVVLPWWRREWQMEYIINDIQRGEHQFQPLIITVGDLFGLTVRRIDLNCEGCLTVMPRPADAQTGEPAWPVAVAGGRRSVSSRRRITELTGPHTPGNYGEPAGTRGSAMTARDGTCTRAYVVGDSLRHVDWRALARGRGWQTRTEAREHPVNRIIALDCRTASYKGDEQLFDDCVSRALWALEQSINDGAAVQLLAGSASTRAAAPPPFQKRRFGIQGIVQAAVRLAALRAEEKRPLVEQFRLDEAQLPARGSLVCITAAIPGAEEWRSLIGQARAQSCQVELWLVLKDSKISEEFKNQLQAWEFDGCTIRLWSASSSSAVMPEVLEGEECHAIIS